MQARLLSSIRSSKKHDTVFAYSNFCYWRERSSAISKLSSLHPRIHNKLNQLACRTLIQIIQPGSQGSNESRDMMLLGDFNLEKDTVQSCSKFITQKHEQLDQGHFVGSFLDSYDIFSAGVVYTCLAFGSSSGARQPIVQAIKIVHRCSTLLTIIGEHFSQFKTFRKIFIVLTDKTTEDKCSQGQVRIP